MIFYAVLLLALVYVAYHLWREYQRQTELERLERAMKERER